MIEGSRAEQEIAQVERQAQNPPKSVQLLMAAVGSGRAAEKIVQRASNLAATLKCPWIAVYVDVQSPLHGGDQIQIGKALELARELGAEVITVTGTDLVGCLLRVARQRNVSQIVIGKSGASIRRFFRHDQVLNQLIRESDDLEVHVVNSGSKVRESMPPRWQDLKEFTWFQYLFAVGVIVAVTFAVMSSGSWIGPPEAAALIFLLAVVVLGSLFGRGPTLVAALTSALLWDYFILPPVFKFSISRFGDALAFGMYFVVALFMGHLTSRIRAQQKIESLGEERATALYLLTRELSAAANLDQIIRRAVLQLEQVFQAQCAVLLDASVNEKKQRLHWASTFTPSEEGRRAANWVFEHSQNAGKFTSHFPLADAFYIPLISTQGVLGVVGLQFTQAFPPTVHQLNLLDAFVEQIVLALDRKRLNEISERAKVLAESERLTKTLLDSMSHEVRTPITAIMGATSILAELEKDDGHALQREMVGEIQEATGRLNRLVGNFLEVSHLESGTVKPNMNDCEVSDLIYTVLAEMEKELVRHQVSVAVAPDLPLVWMDFVLMQHALTNLLSNAVLHTPAGTLIEVSARIEHGALDIIVADSGPGIPAASLDKIFNKFYRAPNAPDGGTGLGLSLVKGFMEAQGGVGTAENRAEGGAKFILHLPLKEKMIPVEKIYE